MADREVVKVGEGKIKKIKGDQIHEYIPHRFENLLIDEIDVYDETPRKGILHVTLKNCAATHHALFFKNKFFNKKDDTNLVILVPFMVEILALGSLVSSGFPLDTYLGLFASISHFKKMRDIYFRERITGVLIEKNRKGGIVSCKGMLQTESGKTIAEAELSAFFLKKDSEPKSSTKKMGTLPPFSSLFPFDKEFFFKDPSMYTVDYIIHWDLNTLSWSGMYRYPATHPLIKGHFPGNPIMMGVMQWMAVEDACFWIAMELKKQNKTPRYISGDAELMKDTGILTAEIRQFKVRIYLDEPPYLNQAELVETQKIVFRDFVVPNETILISLFNVTLE